MVAVTTALRRIHCVATHLLQPKNLVIYADKSIVVLNKPNGLPTQLMSPFEGPRRADDQFATALDDVRNALGIFGTLFTVHRLDKPTTGALILARTARAARDISAQLARKNAKKTYLALACGDASHFPSTSGTIKTDLECIGGQVNIQGTRNPLPPRPGHGENWVKHAITHYEVLASSPKVPLSLLRLEIDTGCKHQIRVHLAQHLGAPVLSDSIYGSPERDAPVRRFLKERYTPFLYLHSSRFSFTRYRTAGPGKAFQFTVGAPLTTPFIDVCRAVDIPIGIDARMGGIWINGNKVRGPGASSADAADPVAMAAYSRLRLANVIEELGGVWYGPNS